MSVPPDDIVGLDGRGSMTAKSAVRIVIVLFEVAQRSLALRRTLALSPIRDTLSEGFSHFVTSIAAPVASGWSRCRVGFAPTGKRRLFTAHAKNRH